MTEYHDSTSDTPDRSTATDSHHSRFDCDKVDDQPDELFSPLWTVIFYG